MRILAFDCCTDTISVAVSDEARPLVLGDAPSARGHAEILMPMICDCLERAGLCFGDLDLLVTTIGPGSFTGIRTGVAAARGLALATKLPVLPLSVNEAIAASTDRTEPFAVVREGRRERYFVQAFENSFTAANDVISCTEAEIIEKLPYPMECVRLKAGADTVDASSMAELARHRMAHGASPVGGFLLQPLYLHPPDARVSAGQSLLQ